MGFRESITKTYVFYHHGCVDGSFVAALRAVNTGNEEELEFVKFAYGSDNLSKINIKDTCSVEFLDCSPTREDMNVLLTSSVFQVRVIDHHETSIWINDFAEQENKLRGYQFIFSMVDSRSRTSAAKIYYDNFLSGAFGGKLDKFIDIISKSDTRAPTLDEMTEKELNVRAAIGFMNSEFEEAKIFVNRFFHMDDHETTLLFEQYNDIGKIISDNNEKNIKALVGKSFLMTICDIEMPVISIGRSDYGLMNKAMNTLAENHPSKVSCSFYIDAGGINDARKVKLSFRSVGDDGRALSVAQLCGGGGHRNAAGALLGEQESLRFVTACLSRSKF